MKTKSEILEELRTEEKTLQDQLVAVHAKIKRWEAMTEEDVQVIYEQISGMAKTNAPPSDKGTSKRQELPKWLKEHAKATTGAF